MRKIQPLFLILLLLVGSSAIAQKSPGKKKGKAFHSGVRLGANFSQLKVENAEFSVINPVGSLILNQFKQNGSYSTGLVGGVWLRAGRTFFIQPEILISAKGGTFDLLQNSATSGTIPQKVQIDFKSTNIDLPFLVGISLKQLLRLYALRSLPFPSARAASSPKPYRPIPTSPSTRPSRRRFSAIRPG